MTGMNCRIYPNGEFSIWEEKRSVEVEPPPEQPDYLGLSLLPNSHRVALGLAEPPPERARRGLTGITRLGARTVRNGAFLLQETYGNDRLAFCTFTLPSFSESEQYLIAVRWAEIVRKFVQALRRLLAAAGLSGSVVGCTEIQGDRYEKDGGLPLHLHILFVGKQPRRRWAVSADQYRALWKNAVTNECPELPLVSWKASVDCQKPKRDMSSYLGKYMSKGVGTLRSMIEGDPGLVDFLPKSWWTCSLKLKRAIGKRITGGNATARKILQDIRLGDTRIKSSKVIEVPMAGGQLIPVAVVGSLSPEGRNKYAWRPGSIIGIDAEAKKGVPALKFG